MHAYIAIISARFRMLLQYRAAALAGIGTQVFWGLIRVMIFEAFYRSTTTAQPMVIEDVITYVWLSQAMLAMIPWNTDPEIRDMVRKGTVAYELLKPVDLYNLWYSRSVATRTAPTLMRSIPIFITAMIFWGMEPPASVDSAIAWAFAMVGAVLLSCAFSTIFNISLIWTISGEGISRIVPPLVMLLSGMLIPIPLFPDWAQTILHLLPFAGIIDLPFRLYVGHIPPEYLFRILALQLSWIMVLVAIGKLMLRRAAGVLVVQGG